MRELLTDAAERAITYLEGLDARGVAPTPEAIATLEQLDEPLPEDPTSPELVLQRLDAIGSPATVAMAGPRYFGFVIGGSLPAALAANWLAGAWDQNAVYYVGWNVEADGLFGAPPITVVIGYGKDKRRCGSASLHGRPPMRT